MKKRGFIPLLLTIFTINNCMESKNTIRGPIGIVIVLFQANSIPDSATLTSKAQERVNLTEKTTVNLDDQTIQKSLTKFLQENHVDNMSMELLPINTLQAHLGLLPTDFLQTQREKQLLINLTNQLEQKRSSIITLLDLIDSNEKTVNPLIQKQKTQVLEKINAIIDELVRLYRRSQAIEQYATNKLIKDETNSFYLFLKNSHFIFTNQLTTSINQTIELQEKYQNI